MTYALKLGDADPPLEFVCLGGDGQPADLTGATLLVCGVRRAGELEPVVLRDATPVDLAEGRVRIVWDPTDSEAMGLGPMEFELQVTRAGRVTTFPSQGYGTFPVWQDIVPGDAS